MIKVFISQLMKDKTDEEILKEREEIIQHLKNYHFGNNNEFEVIDSFLKDFETAKGVNIPVAYLAKSIELLSTANFIVFGKDWEKGRGTVIEHKIAEEYFVQEDILEL